MSACVDVVCIASWNADLTSRIERPLAVGETVNAHGFSVSPGGKGSNAAVAAARMGAQVAVVARIGDDAFGQMALSLWREEGVSTAHVVQAHGEASGVAQILVYASGDNSIAVSAGANAGLEVAHVQAASASIASARVVIASNEVPVSVATAAFKLARAQGAVTLLNPAPACAPSDTLQRLLALCDTITPNENELRLLANLGPHASLDDAAEHLLKQGVCAVLVTLGGSGCCLYRSGEKPLPLPAWPVKVRDTVGAGDTLTGALAACLARGMALENAARYANAAAALSVTGAGALGAMPRLEQVEKLLTAGK
jgi:ribokinase